MSDKDIEKAIKRLADDLEKRDALHNLSVRKDKIIKEKMSDDDELNIPDDFDLFSIIGLSDDTETKSDSEFIEKEKEIIPSPDIKNIKIYNYDDIPFEIYMEFMELNNNVLPGDDDFKKFAPKVIFIIYILNKKVIAGCIMDSTQIQGLVVDEKYQRKGYGTMIMEYCIEQIKKYNIEYLELESTAESDKLYKTLGFIEKGSNLIFKNDTYDKTKNINDDIYFEYLRHLDELNKDYGIKIYNKIDEKKKLYLESKYSITLSNDMLINNDYNFNDVVVIFKKNSDDKMIFCDNGEKVYSGSFNPNGTSEVLSRFHINIIRKDEVIDAKFDEIIKYLINFYKDEHSFYYESNEFVEFTPHSILSTDEFKNIMKLDGKIKRKSIKRKSIKRKSIKRKSIKRKSIKRKSIKRKKI